MPAAATSALMALGWVASIAANGLTQPVSPTTLETNLVAEVALTSAKA